MNTDVKQHDITDCAAACMVSVSRHYGWNVPIAVLREASGTSLSGTTVKGITDACRQIGFKARGYKSAEKDLEPLRHLTLPVILHTVNRFEDLHFVVLYGIGRKKATLMDPSRGKHIRIRLEQLQREWTGFLVTMEPDTAISPLTKAKYNNQNRRKALSRFAGYISFKEYALLFLSSAAYVVAGLCTALFLQFIIDDVIPGQDTARLIKVGSFMVSLMICTLILGYQRIIYSLKTGIRLDSRLVLGYLSHLFRLPVSFFSRRGAGELNSRVGDVARIRAFLTDGAVNIVTSLLILVISFALMFFNHWRLSLLMLTFIPVYLGLYALAGKVNRRVNREIIESSAAFEEKTVESITAVRIIKHFAGEDRFYRSLEKSWCDAALKFFKGGRLMGLFASACDAVSKILSVTLLTVGSVFIFRGSLSIGELVSFYALTGFFSTPLGNLVKISEELSEARIASERIGDITDIEPEGLEETDCPIDPRQDIIFDNISFSYPGCPDLIKNFSLRLRKGSITAVQGESGCGKSTLAALLMRDMKPTEGRILLGPMDITLFDLAQWRRFVSIIPQDPELLSGTILENITCFEKKPDIKKAVEILEELGMRKFAAELPMGVLTRVGQRGCTLSGGQRQRLALARALYRNPQVLILDEATSSLDETSQFFVLKKVAALRDEGRTILMITHKNDNVMIADRTVKI